MSHAVTDTTFAGRSPRSISNTSFLSSSSPTPRIWRSVSPTAAPARCSRSPPGTGVVTRRLASALPDERGDRGHRPEPGDARPGRRGRDLAPGGVAAGRRAELPFPDEAFDAVVCQFGVMFFPDKARAFAEARRVLRAGGVFLFSVWDRIEDNEFADVITDGARDPVSRRSAALPGPHAARLRRPRRHRAGSLRRRIQRTPPNSSR